MAVAVHALEPRTVAGIRTTLEFVASSRLAADASLIAQGKRLTDFRFVVLTRPQESRDGS